MVSYKQAIMSKPIDKGWIALTVTRIISIALAVFAVVLFIWSLSLFRSAGHVGTEANAHATVAEDQPHGLDSLGALALGGLAFGVLATSVGCIILAITMFTGTTLKLRKKSSIARTTKIG